MGTDTKKTGASWVEPAVVILAMIAPSLVPAQAPADVVSWLSSGAVQALSQGALLMVYIGASGRLRDYGIERPRAGDLGRAVLLLGVMLLAARLVAIALPASNAGESPIVASLPSIGAAKAGAVIAWALCFSVAIAYREELFYRLYIVHALRDRGSGDLAAILVSTMLFAAGHAYQGPAGIVSGLLVGSALAVAASKGFRLHALALAHAVYDLGVLLAAFGLAGGPGR